MEWQPTLASYAKAWTGMGADVTLAENHRDPGWHRESTPGEHHCDCICASLGPDTQGIQMRRLARAFSEAKAACLALGGLAPGRSGRRRPETHQGTGAAHNL
jgi:hypothetical protein